LAPGIRDKYERDMTGRSTIITAKEAATKAAGAARPLANLLLLTSP
jgi:hypothetical protein